MLSLLLDWATSSTNPGCQIGHIDFWDRANSLVYKLLTFTKINPPSMTFSPIVFFKKTHNYIEINPYSNQLVFPSNQPIFHALS